MQTPNDCALLITAPLTKEDFLFDLKAESQKDFVKNWAKNQKMASDKTLTDEDLWEIYSQRVRGFVMKLCDEIKALGVEILFNTKFENLSQIFFKKKVITLEAHWFSPKLSVDDFYNLNTFVKKLFESNEIVAKVLRTVLFSGERELPSFQNYRLENGSELISKINRVFSQYNYKTRPPKPIFVKSNDKNIEETFWIHLNRYALEKSFPDEIKQKCKFEMFDGFYSPDDFQSKIPLNFDGVIDFTVCNSELAGVTVKQARPCLVITNRYETDLIKRLILYKGVIRMISERNCQSYVEATIKLRKQLLEKLGGE